MERQKFFAVFFQKLAAGVEGKAAFVGGQQRKEELRTLAHRLIMGGTDMAFVTTHDLDLRDGLRLPTDHLGPCWYAAYTCANHEKLVAKQLAERSVEHFLPLYESVRSWKDRRVHLQLPLFPGYVFVRFALRDRLQVLQIPSVANLVSFNGTPAVLPAAEIQALKLGLERGVQPVPHPYLKVGRRARITAGPLEGSRESSSEGRTGCDLSFRSI